MNHSFDEKTALVTGGARGLGRSVVLSLAGQGANVAIADVDESTVYQTARSVSALNGSVCVIASLQSDYIAGHRLSISGGLELY
jgi:NAD(P)-dependent dehydrogenase (short-subunit alcohol dehydrogenase family)